MRALSYHGPGRPARETVPDPEITHDLDAVIRVDTVTYDVFGRAAETGALKVVLSRRS